MKSTISDIRQLFNVKAIADADLAPSAIPSYTLGIVDESTNVTVKPVAFDTLPESFRLIYKNGKQILYSFDTIRKNRILNVVKKEYVAPKEEIWEGKIEHCDCINSVRLNISFESDLQNLAQGLGFGDTDFFVEVSPEELSCYCSCDNKGVYENYIMTMLMLQKARSKNNPFYEVLVKDKDGKEYDNVKDLREYIEKNKEVNTDDDTGNNTDFLTLVVKGKVIETGNFNPLSQNYQYLRTVRLQPSITVNGRVLNKFKKVQDGVAEIGLGADLKFEEYENYNFYTDNNYRQYISCGVLNDDYNYMFEDDKHYHTLTFEYDSLKQNRAGDGDMKRLLILMGTENKDILNQLEEIFKSVPPAYRTTI